MSRLPWTAFYWEDWRIATAHLSLAERGAYLTLLQHYYQTGKPLLANASDLLRVCCSRDEAEAQAITSVLAQFFELRDGFYHNRRADEELEKRENLSKQRAKAGARGGQQKASNCQTIAKLLPPQSQSQYKTPLTPLSGGLTNRQYERVSKEIQKIAQASVGVDLDDREVVQRACVKAHVPFEKAESAFLRGGVA